MKRREFLHKSCLLAQGLWLPYCGPVWANNTLARILDMRMWTAPDNTRVVFELDRAVEHSFFRLANPERLVLDLKGVDFSPVVAQFSMSDSLVSKVRAGEPKSGVVRVVFDVVVEVKPQAFMLNATNGKGFRLVLDLFRKQQGQPAEVSKPLATAEVRKKRHGNVIVIDPGHGGEDPGAVGSKGTYEKHVAYSVGSKLQELFNRSGFTAHLTRTGDYYVPLRKRVAIGRSFQPDLFISLHADAFRDASARGASVFCLSERGKPSPDAAIEALVRKENDADIIGGVDLSEVGDKEVATILMDLTQRESLNNAILYGRKLLGSLGGITPLKYSEVQQAGFAVLKAPDVPSVLVEMAFLSNPQEEEMLKKDGHQRSLAGAVFEGTRAFLKSIGRS